MIISPAPEAAARRAEAVAAIREVIAERRLGGVVLTRPGPVAWGGGGVSIPIDRGAAEDTVWLAVSADRLVVVTTSIEAPRLAAELLPADVEIRAVPWWASGFLVEAAEMALGVSAAQLAADGHPAFGMDVSHELARRRLDLGRTAVQQLMELGRDATWAVEGALHDWVPGETDYGVQARIAARLEACGADGPVLLVGGDDRVAAWRHPVAMGAPVHQLVMAVLVARRHGLHVALTRYASAGSVPESLAHSLVGARRIHRGVLAACRPGQTYGAAVSALDDGYTAEGRMGGWADHYQGGPIGFGQREFEIAPCQTESPWWNEQIPAVSAVAWNPSLPGGGKDEDTYLLGLDGPELVTSGADRGAWPGADDDQPWRPAVLQRWP